MKKILSFTLLLGFILIFSSTANALEISAYGYAGDDDFSSAPNTDGPNTSGTGSVAATANYIRPGMTLPELEALANTSAYDSGILTATAFAYSNVGFLALTSSQAYWEEDYINNSGGDVNYSLDLSIDNLAMQLNVLTSQSVSGTFYVEVDTVRIWEATIIANTTGGALNVTPSGEDLGYTTSSNIDLRTVSVDGYSTTVSLGTLTPTNTMTVRFGFDGGINNLTTNSASLTLGAGGSNPTPGMNGTVIATAAIPASNDWSLLILSLVLLTVAVSGLTLYPARNS